MPNLSFRVPLIAILSIEMVTMLVKRKLVLHSRPGAMSTILCELGPPPYAMAGHDGKELSDACGGALIMKDLIQALPGLHL